MRTRKRVRPPGPATPFTIHRSPKTTIALYETMLRGAARVFAEDNDEGANELRDAATNWVLKRIELDPAFRAHVLELLELEEAQ